MKLIFQCPKERKGAKRPKGKEIELLPALEGRWHAVPEGSNFQCAIKKAKGCFAALAGNLPDGRGGVSRDRVTKGSKGAKGN